jgi:sulfate permease, SulP family
MVSLRRLSADVKQILEPQTLFPTLAAGFTCGILNIILAISFGAMIFSGKLSAYTSQGIGFLLAATVALSLVAGLFSTIPGVITCIQDGPGAIVAVMVGAIAVNVVNGAAPEHAFLTAVMSVICASLVTGICFWVIGRFKMGNLIRFMPYPVLGGFLAGTGYFLFQGGVSVMIDEPLSLERLSYLLQTQVLLHWLPGIGFGIALYLVLRRSNHFLVVPGMLVAGILLFYLVLMLSQHTVDDALQKNFLLGPFPSGALYQPPDYTRFTEVNWQVILDQSGSIMTVALVSVVSMLLNLSGLEVVARRDIDLNKELQTTGLANVLAGLLGGSPGFAALGNTSLSIRLGAKGRFPSIIVAVMTLLIMLLGTNLLTVVPKFVLGGLLVYLGLSFLIEWLYDGWFRFRKTDYFTIVTILLVMITIGIIDGVTVGLLFAILLFVVDYSRLNVVKRKFSGKYSHSNVIYTHFQDILIEKQSDQIYVMELQGYLFFGVADSLLAQINKRCADADSLPLRYLILDFHQTTGYDISAIISFVKIKLLADNNNFMLIYTNISEPLRKSLVKEVFKTDSDALWRVFPSMDRAIEWCEKQILQTYEDVGLQSQRRPRPEFDTLTPETESTNFPEMLLMRWLNLTQTEIPPGKLSQFFERKEIPANTVVVRQGQLSDGIYIIESGQVEVMYEANNPNFTSQPTRIRSIGSGAVSGQASVYSGQPAILTTTTAQPCVVHFLSIANLKKMDANVPEIAVFFHRFMALLISMQANRTLEAMDSTS